MTAAPGSSGAVTAGLPPLQMEVFTSPTRVIGGDSHRTFPPVTSTLIFGDEDAVLVDAQFMREDVQALGDTIEGTGRRLVAIFITHGHGDHYLGAGRLAERFSGAKIVATPGVVSYIESHVGQDVKTWSAMFGDDAVTPSAVPSPLGAVVAGDVAYNQIHQMLGFGGPAEWAKWIESIDAIERLRPRVVVAGHKKPGAADDDAAGILNGTRAYIRDFAEAAGSAGLVEGLVGAMRAKYPDHGNLTTLLFSASAAFKGRTRP